MFFRRKEVIILLKLTNIEKIYHTGDEDIRALKNINLSFEHAQFVSVLGPSGCGKTTLLNVIGGLSRYNSGDLKISTLSTIIKLVLSFKVIISLVIYQFLVMLN